MNNTISIIAICLSIFLILFIVGLVIAMRYWNELDRKKKEEMASTQSATRQVIPTNSS